MIGMGMGEQMKKIWKVLLAILCVAMVLCGCSTEEKADAGSASSIESSVEDAEENIAEPSVEADAQETTKESGDLSLGEFVGEEPQVEASGDGWYFVDGMLYVTKIYYRVLDVAGNYHCVYEEPWIAYKNDDKIRDLVIDADMVYKEETDKKLAGNFRYGQDSFAGGGPLFGNMDSLETITIKTLNLDKIRDISYMFADNVNLVFMDASGLYMSGVEDASFLFFNNTSMYGLNTEGWNTGSMKNMEAMFRNCSSLTSVWFGSWSTNNVKSFAHMFDGCSSLTQASLNGWTINNANVAGMFANCDNLCEVNLSNVSLTDTPTAAMFDEHNSMKSYQFADGWEISKNQPIGDDCFKAVAVFEPVSMVCMVTIIYKKPMPGWYKEYVEDLQNVEDFFQIHESEMMDVFISREDGEISVTDVIDGAIKCLNEIGDVNEEDAELLSGLVQKLDVIMIFRDGYDLDEKDFEEAMDDVLSLTELAVDEIEQLGEALSSEENNE